MKKLPQFSFSTYNYYYYCQLILMFNYHLCLLHEIILQLMSHICLALITIVIYDFVYN